MADPSRKVGVVFERKHQHTGLVVTERRSDKGLKYFHFDLIGSYQGEGYREGWSAVNKWRVIGAGKNAQARLDSKINGMMIRRRGFRGRL